MYSKTWSKTKIQEEHIIFNNIVRRFPRNSGFSLCLRVLVVEAFDSTVSIKGQKRCLLTPLQVTVSPSA